MSLNAFTVDVEDYYQVEALKSAVNFSDWSRYESRVVSNTDKILALLAEREQKATFFVLGYEAKQHPNLVRRIVAEGHELASHGMTHQLIYRQSPKVFKQETRDAKRLLEDIGGVKVEGYRAATYSITDKSLWALDILLELGFRYDSSIFPVRHDKYGIADIEPMPHQLTTPEGNQIVEFPISTVNLKIVNLPIAGGGYFRLFPYWFSRWGLSTLSRKEKPMVFYIHPWEVDPEQPRVEEISKFSKFRHYNNLDKCLSRLECLTRDFDFTTMKSVLIRQGLLQ